MSWFVNLVIGACDGSGRLISVSIVSLVGFLRRNAAPIRTQTCLTRNMTSVRPPQATDDPGEFDRLAVLAIQGGGVYGLNMLGQLATVIDHYRITPLAYAGTSAGAVVAALSWAGYSPKEIRDIFIKLAVDAIHPTSHVAEKGAPESVLDLLGPFDHCEVRFDYQSFKWLAKYLKGTASYIESTLDPLNDSSHQRGSAKALLSRSRLCGCSSALCLLLAVTSTAFWSLGFLSTWAWAISAGAALIVLVLLGGLRAFLNTSRTVLDHARGMLTLIQAILKARSKDAAWLRPSTFVQLERALDDCSRRWPRFAPDVISTALDAMRAYGQIYSHAYVGRGFFPGEAFERFIDECLKDSPLFRPHRDELGDVPLTFGRVRELVDDEDNQQLEGVVPLILTATNLTTQKLVLFNSYEDKFDNLSIAKAVRASAGFPVFFKPVEVDCLDVAGMYVDGGMISNFPAWVFSRELRRNLARSGRYRDLATRPWLNVGLRVVTDRATFAASDGQPSALD